MVILPPTFLYVLLVTSDHFYSLGCWPTDLIFLRNLWIWFCCGVAALVHTFQGTFVTKGTHVSSTSFGIVTRAVPDSPVSYGPATKLPSLRMSTVTHKVTQKYLRLFTPSLPFKCWLYPTGISLCTRSEIALLLICARELAGLGHSLSLFLLITQQWQITCKCSLKILIMQAQMEAISFLFRKTL